MTNALLSLSLEEKLNSSLEIKTAFVTRDHQPELGKDHHLCRTFELLNQVI